MNKLKLILGALVLLVSGQAGAAIIQVDLTGQLIGATGVNVSGTLYDVKFLDDTCPNLFPECDDVSDFVFQSITAAEEASMALHSQVLMDGVLGLFGTDPTATAGCDDSIQCLRMTPYDSVALSATAFQTRFVAATTTFPGTASLSFGGRNRDIDMALVGNRVWAAWELSPDPCSGFPGGGNTGGEFPGGGNTGGCFPGNVPAPPALWLFGTGLLGLIGVKWRRKAQ